MVDVACKAIAGLADTAVSADACLGALAAIRAAKLQAAAATSAGYLTMVAAIVALLAACIAYIGQLRAANIQVRMSERKEEIEQAMLAKRLLSEIVDSWVEVNLMANRIRVKDYTRSDKTLLDSLPLCRDLCRNFPVVDWDKQPYYKELEKTLLAYWTVLTTVIASVSMLDATHGMFRNAGSVNRSSESLEGSVLESLGDLETYYKEFYQWVSNSNKANVEVKEPQAE